MYGDWTLVGAILGGLTGNGLRRPIFALSVEPGEPDRHGCPACGAVPMSAVPDWRGRCRSCRHQVGPRWGSVELLSALLCGGIALAFGASFQTIGFTAMAVVGVALGVIDLQSFRLPTKLIAISTALLLASLLAAAATSGAWVPLRSGMLGAAGLSAAFLLLAVIRPGQLGLGDVKLAVPLGLLLGWFGWPFVVFGGCLAFLLSAATILVLLALGKLTLRSSVPFGPFMLAGTVVALLL